MWAAGASLCIVSCDAIRDPFPPTITVEQAEPIGLGPSEVTINATDNSGISMLEVRTDGATGPVVFSRTYSPPVASVSQVVVVSAYDEVNHEQGTMMLHIRAEDGRQEASDLDAPVTIDSGIPSIRLVRAPRRLENGSIGAIFVRADGPGLSSVGLMVGGRVFKGVLARDVIADAPADQYLILFAISDELSGVDARVFARSTANNTVSLPVVISAAPGAGGNRQIALSKDEISQLMVGSSISISRELSLLPGKAATFAGVSTASLPIPAFFGPVRELSVAYLQRVTTSSNTFGFLTDPLPEAPGTLLANFGETITFQTGSATVGAGESFLQLRETSSPTTDALGDGVVAFSENLGPLGNMVGIDHGLGVMTLYGLLDVPQVQVGSKVFAGTPLGSAIKRSKSMTFLATYGATVSGVPVNITSLQNRRWFDELLGRDRGFEE